MNTEPKAWWQSRTIIGAVISALAMVAGPLGLNLDAEAQSQIVTILLTLAGVVGPILSVWGRISAKAPIANPGAGTAKALVIAVALGAVAIGGPTACASYTAGTAEQATPAQTVYAIQTDYAVALRSAAAYIATPDADPDAVAAIKRLDAVAYGAVRDAMVAVRAGDSPGTAAAIGAARAAVTALAQYMIDREDAR